MRLQMIMMLLLFGVLVGCNKEAEPHKPVAKKYCLEVCMQYTFKMFHHGQSFGGSISMNGLGQSQIFDRVKQECELFYSDETCCERGHGNYKGWRTNHGYDYGVCPAPP